MDRKLFLGMVWDWGLALVLVVVLMGISNYVIRPMNLPPKGEPAPDFTLPDLQGASWTLSEHTGDQPVVLNFWATWCGPCRAEIPEFNRFAQSHPDVEVVGISVDRNMGVKRLDAAARRLGIDYLVLHDALDEVAGPSYGVSSLPTTVVLHPDGSIKTIKVGAVDGARLERMVYAP